MSGSHARSVEAKLIHAIIPFREPISADRAHEKSTLRVRPSNDARYTDCSWSRWLNFYSYIEANEKTRIVLINMCRVMIH
jgi:hypothetical protein